MSLMYKVIFLNCYHNVFPNDLEIKLIKVIDEALAILLIFMCAL